MNDYEAPKQKKAWTVKEIMAVREQERANKAKADKEQAEKDCYRISQYFFEHLNVNCIRVPRNLTPALDMLRELGFFVKTDYTPTADSVKVALTEAALSGPAMNYDPRTKERDTYGA